jgi:hypothetical protein
LLPIGFSSLNANHDCDSHSPPIETQSQLLTPSSTPIATHTPQETSAISPTTSNDPEEIPTVESVQQSLAEEPVHPPSSLEEPSAPIHHITT